MKQKVCLVNLGCKVNQYELDSILNSLKDDFEVVSGLCFADLYIVNTCAVTLEAEKKSRQFLSKIVKLNPQAKIYVLGCASQHNPMQFLGKKGVVAVYGNSKKGEIKNNLHKSGNFVCPLDDKYEDNFFATNVRTRGYVKIQDGCNNFCSYCLIPYIRGMSRSRNLQSIVDEATALSKKCSEIVLTGIDVSDFKIDGMPALKSLIQNLSHLPCRVRLSSFEPNVITTEFLQTAKNAPNFCPHFHLSLQSGCNSVLKQMNRHYTTEQFLQKVEQIRQFFPLAGITTDIIVGYPTETEKDFEQTLDFVERVGFSKVHYFAYSSRPGTRASKLGQLDGNIVKERENKLATLSKKLAQNFLRANIGQPLEVLVEKSGEQSEGLSRNYIRCHINQNLPENSVVEVVGTKIYGEGLLCELKSEIFGRCGTIDEQDLKFALAEDVVVFLKNGKKIEGWCSQFSNEWQNSKL